MTIGPERVLADTYEGLIRRNPGELEFHQAVQRVFASIGPALAEIPEPARREVIEQLCEPERQIIFRVPWQDDRGHGQINRGFCVEFSSALGPYKGGIRFHPSVNLGIVKFLAFEQVFKNALTGLRLGAGKGGSDFDPKGKSPGEVMRFCQSFMIELHRHIGEHSNIPAGDIGVGVREIGFMFGQYKRLTGRHESGAFTGKGAAWGGSLARPEATGYGAAFFLREMLQTRGQALEGKRCVVSGAGNVAIHAIEKLHQLGARVVACSDSDGVVRDEHGIDLATLKRIKQVEHARLHRYVEHHRHAEYLAKGKVWSVPCDVALPAATQNELTLQDAQTLLDNGCGAVCEGANMPATPDAVRLLLRSGIAYAPAKAANAGGVVVSALEMQQNAGRDAWSFATTENKLEEIMACIHATCRKTAARLGDPDNYLDGANVAGFEHVAKAMLALGLV